MLCPSLDWQVQERLGHPGMTPVKGHRGVEGPGASVTQGETDRAGTVHLGESLGAGREGESHPCV